MIRTTEEIVKAYGLFMPLSKKMTVSFDGEGKTWISTIDITEAIVKISNGASTLQLSVLNRVLEELRLEK